MFPTDRRRSVVVGDRVRAYLGAQGSYPLGPVVKLPAPRVWTLASKEPGQSPGIVITDSPMAAKVALPACLVMEAWRMSGGVVVVS